MTEVPNQRSEREYDRLAAQGRSTDDNSQTTLLLIHLIDRSWTVHCLGAPGITLSEASIVALAESILKRARREGGGQ